MSQNPYTNLRSRAFWSPSVGQRNMFDIDQLWEAPFAIKPETKIVTYGSCFAQHFSRALTARGFNWLDTEPAPKGLTVENAKEFNYGVFSARTANIYTTSLLRQWTEWALGIVEDPKIFWEKDGRIFDPFRPTIEPNGFASVEEMYSSRATCINSFRKSIMKCNVFVFTLGLTESWWDAEGQYEYPMCPGTVAGEFDAKQHVFVNQDYNSVRKNLREAILLMRKARPKGPKFILTVSPVPLVATNSGNHVLVATMESKSVLRAVAGNVATKSKNVSYFPSYEIINAAPYRASFFDPNMRGVNAAGVSHVMKTFFAGLDLPDTDASDQPKRTVKPAKKRVRKTDDVTCDEELLEVFAGSEK